MKRTAKLVTLCSLLCTVTVGCGIHAQDSAEKIVESDVPFGLTDRAPPSTTPAQVNDAVIYLVRGAQLTAVTRKLAESTPEHAVEALLKGPTPDEGRAGLTTAVPTSARLNTIRVRNGTAVVDLGGEFLETNVGDSALGIGQIVHTLAEYPGIARVRFELGGAPVGIPIGDGTTSKSAVTPADYPADP